MIKIVEITTCASCPSFDNEYYTYEEYCNKLERKIKYNNHIYQYTIPEDCPLETKKDDPTS